MKFSVNGIGRKNGFYFKIDHEFYLDGEKTAQPWTISLERHDRDGRVTDFLRLHRTHRFDRKEDAEQFCEDIADKKYSMDQLRSEENAATAAYEFAVNEKKKEAFSILLQDFKSIGVDPMLLPIILQKVYGMDPEIRVLASNPEKIRQCLQPGQKESLFDQISHAAARQVFPSSAAPAPSRTSPEH